MAADIWIEGERYSGNWRMVMALDGYAMNRKIQLPGWISSSLLRM